MTTSLKEKTSYATWYDFKKELQRRSGIVLLNQLWLQIKPRFPLPWYESHMKETLSLLSNRIKKLAVCPRCGGNLLLDRDIDGQFMRCIQCSFSIEINPPKAPKQKLYEMNR